MMGDGTIPEEHKLILDEIGAWVNLNEEAIFASKPWKIYGDNLFSYLKREEGDGNVTDLEALKKQKQNEQFNERTLESEPYGHDEVRFTTKDDVLYVFVLNPEEGEIEIPSLGIDSKFSGNKIKSIKLIGGKRKVEFSQDEEKLNLTIPEVRPNEYVAVFEVAGVL